MSTIQERVARGAAWLDENQPGWRDQINLDQLSLYSNDRCVLGQVFHCPDVTPSVFTCGFSFGLRALREAGEERSISQLGFNADSRCWDDLDLADPARIAAIQAETAALEAEWRRVIHQPSPIRSLATA